MAEQEIIALVHTGIAVLLIGLGFPLWQRRVGPNMWYGFRTPATMSDERIWYPVNQETGGWMIATGLVTLAVVIVTYAMDLGIGGQTLFNTTALVAGVLVMCVRGFTLTGRLKRSLPAE